MKQKSFFCNISLRCKLTLLITILVTLIAIFLTSISIFNANKIFIPAIPIQTVLDTADSENNPVTFSSQATSLKEATVSTTVGFSQEGFSDASTDTVDMISITLQKQTFQTHSIIIMGVIIFAGAFLAWLITGKALKSLAILTKTIEYTNINHLSQTIDQSDMSDLETKQLAKAFNQLMQRIDKAFEAQKRFTAAAAHELKTPLACIQTDIEVLQLYDTPSLEDYHQTMHVILRNTNRLIELTNQLLSMHCVTTECLQEVSISHMIAEIEKTLQCKLAEKEITFVFEGKGSIFAHYDILYRAFFNIIENAIKYNKQQGNITINCNQTEEALFVSIADTGMGISLENQKDIFEPFYRVDSSRCRKIGGSGLGLSIAKEIIMQYNGTIAVESQINKGSTFFISFCKKDLPKT